MYVYVLFLWNIFCTKHNEYRVVFSQRSGSWKYGILSMFRENCILFSHKQKNNAMYQHYSMCNKYIKQEYNCWLWWLISVNFYRLTTSENTPDGALSCAAWSRCHIGAWFISKGWLATVLKVERLCGIATTRGITARR